MNIKQLFGSFKPQCEQEIQDLRLILSYADQFEDILTRKNEILHCTASAWIVNPARTHVLMVYHNIYNSWSWTGGHADGESDLLAVALKEAREETSVREIRPVSSDIFSVEILTVQSHIKRGKYVSPHLHLNATFLLEAETDQVIRNKPDENSAVGWISLPDSIALSTEPAMQVIYRKLNDRLAKY